MTVRRSCFHIQCLVFRQLLAAIVLVSVPLQSSATPQIQNKCSLIFSNASPKIDETPQDSETQTLAGELDRASQNLGLTQSWRSALPPRPVIEKGQWFTGGLLSGNTDPDHQGETGIHFQKAFTGSEKRTSITVQAPDFPEFPFPEFLGETLGVKGQKFRLINVGKEQTRQEIQKLNPFIDNVLKTLGQKHNVFITLNKSFVRSMWILNQMENLATTMTTEVYKKYKPYLLNEDLTEIYWNDLFATNRADYFLILKESDESVLEMTEAEARASLLAGLKVVRPATHGIGTNFDYLRHHDRLPFLSRLNPHAQKDVGLFLDSLDRQGKQVAELSRFAKFGDVPQEIMRSLVKKALDQGNRARGGDIDIFFFACDAKTKRQFALYGFSEFITVDDAEVPEFIMMLDTSSENFRKTMAMLENASHDVTAIPIAERPDQSRWSQGWPGGIERMQYAAQVKERNAHRFLSRLRNEVRNSQHHLSLPNTEFTNQYVVSELRAQEIASSLQDPKVDAYLNNILNSGDTNLAKMAIRNAFFFMLPMEDTAAFFARNLPSQGKIYVVGDYSDVFAETISSQFSERSVEAFHENNLPPEIEPADSIIILSSSHSNEPTHLTAVAWAKAKIKGHREIFNVNPLVPPQSGYVSHPQPPSLSAYATEAANERAPMTELELALALKLIQNQGHPAL